MTEWQAFVLGTAVVATAIFTAKTYERLRKVVRLLEHIATQQAEANSSLRSIEHDSEVIRTHTPPR